MRTAVLGFVSVTILPVAHRLAPRDEGWGPTRWLPVQESDDWNRTWLLLQSSPEKVHHVARLLLWSHPKQVIDEGSSPDGGIWIFSGHSPNEVGLPKACQDDDELRAYPRVRLSVRGQGWHHGVPQPQSELSLPKRAASR